MPIIRSGPGIGRSRPAIFERSQIFDAVALHRLEQPLEPLASGCVVRRATVRIGISSFMVRRTAAPRALDEVFNSLERRPDALHQRHDAVSRRDQIGFRHGPDLGGSTAMGFLRVCLAVTTVVLALAAVRRLWGGRSGSADGGRRYGCSGGRRLAQHRRRRIRPGDMPSAMNSKPGERWKQRLLTTR